PTAVAHADQRAERQPPATLDHLGHAVDVHHALLVGTALRRTVESPHQISKPPSRAPSASAWTRPWYSRPPRSNTARSTPAALARAASALPTARARDVLSRASEPAAIPTSEAAASVRAARSSTSWA